MGRKLAERLAPLYHKGKELRTRMRLAPPMILGGQLTGNADQRLLEWENSVREWDGRVLRELHEEKRHALVFQWQSAGSLPPRHSTLGLIEPTTDIAQLSKFMDAKLGELREIIEGLGG
jgi:hypothetical protein